MSLYRLCLLLGGRELPIQESGVWRSKSRLRLYLSKMSPFKVGHTRLHLTLQRHRLSNCPKKPAQARAPVLQTQGRHVESTGVISTVPRLILFAPQKIARRTLAQTTPSSLRIVTQ